MIRTAAILARGRGERMRLSDESATLTDGQKAAADKGGKVMMPFARPFLDYAISALADAGIEDVIIVIDPAQQDIRDHYLAAFPPERTRVRFAEQQLPRGTADAVVAASLLAGDRNFLVVNADNYYPVSVLCALAECESAATIGFDVDALVTQGNIQRDRVKAFAVLESDAEGYLKSIVEKPSAADAFEIPSSRFVGMNCWVITADIVDACKRVPLSERGEYELPQAVALAISEGEKIRIGPAKAAVFDLSRRSDVVAVAEALADIVPHT